MSKTCLKTIVNADRNGAGTVFNDGCVELSWKWGVPKQYLKWEVVPDQPAEAEKPRLITFIIFHCIFNIF